RPAQPRQPGRPQAPPTWATVRAGPGHDSHISSPTPPPPGRMTMRQRVTTAVGIAAAGALLAACGGSPETASSAKVKSAADGKQLSCAVQMTSQDTADY